MNYATLAVWIAIAASDSAFTSWRLRIERLVSTHKLHTSPKYHDVDPQMAFADIPLAKEMPVLAELAVALKRLITGVLGGNPVEDDTEEYPPVFGYVVCVGPDATGTTNSVYPMSDVPLDREGAVFHISVPEVPPDR